MKKYLSYMIKSACFMLNIFQYGLMKYMEKTTHDFV
jgi:hypothetical protein